MTTSARPCTHHGTNWLQDGQVYNKLQCLLCNAIVYGCKGGHRIFEGPEGCVRCESIFGAEGT